jgi:hypothetical protein
MNATSEHRVEFVVWHRRERGVVAGPFATRAEARRVLSEDFHGNHRLHVRTVPAEAVKVR